MLYRTKRRKDMVIRAAREEDVAGIMNLLKQVARVHYEGRSDIFLPKTKHDEDDVKKILCDKSSPILVAEEDGKIIGHAFLEIHDYRNHPTFCGFTTLHLDDLCVDEAARGKGVGTALYRAAESMAKELGCHNLTLNVWECNPNAKKFYAALGLQPIRTTMEQIIK